GAAVAVVGEQPVQAVQRLGERAATVQQAPLDHQPHRQAHPDELAGVDQLGEAADVDLALAEGEHVHVSALDPGAAAGGGVHRARVDHPVRGRSEAGVGALRGQRPGPLGDVVGAVGVQHDDPVGDVEVVAAAAHHQHGGDAVLAVERADQVHEGGERLPVAVHQLLHAGVADHQVGGGGVLVHQQGGRAGLQRLGDVGRLGGGAGAVGGAEPGGVGTGGQVAHE